ncbi:MAG: 50S ribosomal protein L37e [archaeon]
MGKGTPSFGKRQNSLHIVCRRCGRHAYHKKKSICAACGYGRSKKLRNYDWQNKDLNKVRLV